MAYIRVQIALVCSLALVTGGCGPRRPGVSLMEAAHKGDLEKVRSHLYWGSDVNVRDREGWTPLHMAVAYGHKEVARLLIEKGADIDAANRFGRTPLHWAVRRDDVEFVELLVVSGARPDSRDAEVRTPLRWAVELGHKEAAKYLIINMKDVPEKDELGFTPLHWAVKLGDVELSRLLIDRGADVNAKSEAGYGKTPLEVARDNGHEEMADFLVARGAREEAKTLTAPPPSPTWVTKGSGISSGDLGRAFYGVGAAPKMDNIAMQRDVASNRARSEILKLFHTYISYSVKRYVRTKRKKKDYETEVIRVQKSVTSGDLHGAQIVDRWRDPQDGTMYALAMLDLDSAQEILVGNKQLDRKYRNYTKAHAVKLFEDLERDEKNAEPATTLEDTVRKIEALAAKAREAKDIIWLNCVNEKLTMVKGLSRIASQARQAAESGRPDLVAHSTEAIETCLEKARLLLSDAEQCTGEPETYFGSTKVEVQIDPDSPLDGPLVGDDPVVNGYTPAFRISSFDEPAGKTLLMVLFRNRIDAPDSLSQLLVKVDVKILLDQSGDKVVAAGEDRLVFKGEVRPGSHSVLLRLTYRCKRGRKSFRIKATSGHSPEVPAGKITLVEIISTLRDRPKPPAPTAADLMKLTP